MSTILRTPKAGSDWTANELLAYNIYVNAESSPDFFGYFPEDQISLDALDPALVSTQLDAIDYTAMSDDAHRLLSYIDLAARANAGQDSAIHDVARETLRVLGFEERGTILRSRYAIHFVVCGENVAAQTDVCLIQRNSTSLLIVQSDKNALSSRDPEPQVVAEAIAAFQQNNRKRTSVGLVELDTMVIPCITMIGTRPIFYKIPVTKALSDAVITGRYPQQRTVVSKCVVIAQSRRLSEGMEVPEFRRVLFQYYEAFRMMARDLWEGYKV